MPGSQNAYAGGMRRGNIGPDLVELAEYFKGPVGTALMNNCYGNRGMFERDLLILRLEFIEIFNQHYPVTSQCYCQEHFFVYADIGVHCYCLQKQVIENRLKDCVASSKLIVHLIELMSIVMKKHQMLWFSCHRCVCINQFPTTFKFPVLKCLALKYGVPPDVMAKAMRLPEPCSCTYITP